MSSTRTAIRQEAAARLGALQYPYPSTAASGTTTTAIISDAIDSVNSEYDYTGCWAYFLDGGNDGLVRRVQSYAPGSGQITFNRALSEAVAASDTFELHSWFDPRIWNTCINRALRNMPRLRKEEITVVTNQTEYSLFAHTWLTRPSQITRLIIREGDTSGEYRYHEVPSSMWVPVIDDDALSLILTQPMTLSDTQALFIEAVGPYSELDSDAATTTADLDWAAFGALRQAYDVYGKIIDEGGKRTVLIDADAVMRKFQQLTREFAPRFNSVLRLAPPGHI
jgi:hypothetical protein